MTSFYLSIFFLKELGVSPDPCQNTYPGSGPFTEPEVRAVADFVSQNNVVSYLAYHNCYQSYMIPYGFTDDLPPDYDELVSRYIKGGGCWSSLPTLPTLYN